MDLVDIFQKFMQNCFFFIPANTENPDIPFSVVHLPSLVTANIYFDLHKNNKNDVSSFFFCDITFNHLLEDQSVSMLDI